MVSENDPTQPASPREPFDDDSEDDQLPSDFRSDRHSFRAGDRIGKFRLLQKIGEGGMGVVWLAETKDPIHRRVAIKLIKEEYSSHQEVQARFRGEFQSMADLDHPGIGRIHDLATVSYTHLTLPTRS